MKLPLKIVLINVGVAVLFGILVTGIGSDFMLSFGLASLVLGVLDLITGLFLLAMTDKRYAQGFLLSGGVLLLLGFITCSAGPALNLH